MFLSKMPLLIAALLVFSHGLIAQKGPRQPMPVADRVSRTIERLTTELSLSASQAKGIDPVYTWFYTELDQMRSGGERPSPEAREKLTDARNEKLKKILSEEQMKKLLELEAQMRERRPGN